jgi:hypothetical protein
MEADMNAQEPNDAETHRDDDGKKPDSKDTQDRKARQEELLDEGVEETFPASDPVSVKRIT